MPEPRGSLDATFRQGNSAAAADSADRVSKIGRVILEVEGTILLIEDDPIGAEVIGAYLRRSVEVFHVESIAQATEFMRGTHNVGGLVVDLVLPDGNGLDLIASVRERHILLPIMVLTAHNDPQLINRAQELGAEFVCKPPTADNLESFIRRVIANDYIDEEWMVKVLGFASATWGLSPLEVRTVSLSLAGVPRAELAERLFVSENTVKTVVRRVLRKSESKNLDHLVIYLLRRALSGDDGPE